MWTGLIGRKNYEPLKFPFFAHSGVCEEQSPSYADIELALERNKQFRLKCFKSEGDIPPPLDSMDQINSTSHGSLLGQGLSHALVVSFSFQIIILT